MNIIFFGTPDFVLPILEILYKEIHLDKTDDLIVAVVTQEPKIAGRDKRREFSAVDNWAHKKEIPVIYNLNEIPEGIDLGIVAAYGKIIPQNVINKFTQGILNIHPSLLPKYRGASPIQAQIASNETKTGVTIIKMDSEMDHGPIISSFPDEININETNEELTQRLFERSAEFLINLIPSYMAGKINLKEQNHEDASYTTLITKEHGFLPMAYIMAATRGETIDEEFLVPFCKGLALKVTPQNIYNMIRALKPWPGVWTIFNEKRLKIIDANFSENTLIINTVQLEGRNEVSWKQFKEAFL